MTSVPSSFESPPEAFESVMEHILQGVRKQIEFYFSTYNLTGDQYLMDLLAVEPVGGVPVIIIASFPKIMEWYNFYVACFHSYFSGEIQPWRPNVLVLEAMRTSPHVFMQNGFLFPDTWAAMQAMQQRQYASPVPTSVSSASSETSPHAPRNFYPSGPIPNNLQRPIVDRNNNNKIINHQHNGMLVAPTPWQPDPAAEFYPEHVPMQNGYVNVNVSDVYDYGSQSSFHQHLPLMGNYVVGYSDSGIPLGMVATFGPQHPQPPLNPSELVPPIADSSATSALSLAPPLEHTTKVSEDQPEEEEGAASLQASEEVSLSTASLPAGTLSGRVKKNPPLQQKKTQNQHTDVVHPNPKKAWNKKKKQQKHIPGQDKYTNTENQSQPDKADKQFLRQEDFPPLRKSADDPESAKKKKNKRGGKGKAGRGNPAKNKESAVDRVTNAVQGMQVQAS